MEFARGEQPVSVIIEDRQGLSMSRAGLVNFLEAMLPRTSPSPAGVPGLASRRSLLDGLRLAVATPLV